MTNADPFEPPRPAPVSTVSSLTGNLISVIGLVLSGLFLANPGMGAFLEIPDIIPGIGNLDEVVATTIFLACLSRLGINVLPHGGSRKTTVVDSHVVKD